MCEDCRRNLRGGERAWRCDSCNEGICNDCYQEAKINDAKRKSSNQSYNSNYYQRSVPDARYFHG